MRTTRCRTRYVPLHRLDVDALDKNWARELANGSNYQQTSLGANRRCGPCGCRGGGWRERVHRAPVTV